MAEAPERERTAWSVMIAAAGDPIRAADIAGALIYRYAELEKRQAWVRQVAQAQRDQIERWERGEIERVEAQMARLSEHLRTYAADQYPARERTIRLPQGTLKRRRRGAVVQSDPDLVLQFLQGQGVDEFERYTRVKVEPKLRDFKAACEKRPDGSFVFTPTGEIVAVLEQRSGEITLEKRPLWEDPAVEKFEVEPAADLDVNVLNEDLPLPEDLDDDEWPETEPGTISRLEVDG